MITQHLIDYIKQQQTAGKSKEEITSALLGQGWKPEDVEQGFNHVTTGAPMPPMAGTARLPKARQIFNEAREIYKTNFKTLIILSATPTLALMIGGGLLAGGEILGSTSKFNLMALGITGILLGLVIIIAMIYISIWAAVASLFTIKDQHITWKEAFARAKPRVWPFLLTGLLSSLAILGGLILLVIPGIIFALWFSQSSYIVVEENLQTSAALKRSKYYIKGRIGETFGKLFYIGLITLALYILAGLITAPFGTRESNPVSVITSNILSIVWTPLTLAFGYTLFRHLKRTRP